MSRHDCFSPCRCDQWLGPTLCAALHGAPVDADPPHPGVSLGVLIAIPTLIINIAHRRARHARMRSSQRGAC